MSAEGNRKSKRVEAQLAELLSRSPELERRVERGLTHLRSHGLLGKVGVCDTPASKDTDPAYFARIGVMSAEEAVNLGFRGEPDEIKHLKRLWTKKLTGRA